jgi:superfamily I DNA and/or RNA helicase/very-short-patch-repair endonuclease
LVDNELAKKMRHIPLRQLMGRAGGALQALTPCFLMSPISVAQYLPPGKMKFDLLVIDEASQMRVEDAIGAVTRAKQVVVVGDPQQLPPSSFFHSSATDDEEDESQVDEPLSAESILDCALASFQPCRDLRWHYRSKHESLIAFSNQHFYENRLQIFPSPEPNNPALGVELRLVGGTFQASLNEIEAREVAEAAVRFMEEHPERSLGVVAMNKKQADTIEEYVDELARTRTQAEVYRTKWSSGLEPFFVKNLENVQGDERDTIIIGMTYGPDPKTKRVFQRFGPINGPSGHRRLNVLFTRAKERVIVLSSMTANDIMVAENSSQGVRALKGYLQYAKDGLLEGGETSARAPDSPFEEQVIEALRSAGYEAVPQVGVKGFFIDIGIKHPSYPHGYLCGVECDGASYHSSRTARDRDRLREDILQRLGWKLVRIWSTDWFSDPRGERARLIGRLEEIRGALVGGGGRLLIAGE